MERVRIDVLPHQAKFIQSNKTHTGLIAGYGAGKTFAGILKTIIMKLRYPGIPVAYYLPTYGLIQDVAFPKFAEIFEMLGVAYELKAGAYEFHTAYGKIIMRSMNNPERIVGYEVGYSLIDETDILPTADMTDVFSKIIARNRRKLPNADINKTDVVGTPEGFKWAYNFFVKEQKSNRCIIKGKTVDNPFLPSNYIDTLMESYTPQQLEAYLNGEFVNLTSGTVYHRFDRHTNYSDRTIQENDVLHIGMDFNVTKMNAVVHVIDGSIKTAVDEITDGYDTPEMCKLIHERYAKHKIVIYPDASGDNRDSAGKSDIDILKKAGFLVRKLSKNPFVKDRVNAMNMAFLDSKGNISYYVNTNNCPVYTEALERQTYKNGEPDKKSGFDHVTEAGGYFIYYQSKNTGSWGKSRQA